PGAPQAPSLTAPPPPSATTPATAPATPVAGNKTAAAAATPAPVPAAPEPPKPDPAIAAANERLELARAKIASNVLEPALGDLRQIVKEFPGTPAAADASYMTAELLEKMGRIDDAMA